MAEGWIVINDHLDNRTRASHVADITGSIADYDRVRIDRP